MACVAVILMNGVETRNRDRRDRRDQRGLRGHHHLSFISLWLTWSPEPALPVHGFAWTSVATVLETITSDCSLSKGILFLRCSGMTVVCVMMLNTEFECCLRTAVLTLSPLSGNRLNTLFAHFIPTLLLGFNASDLDSFESRTTSKRAEVE